MLYEVWHGLCNSHCGTLKPKKNKNARVMKTTKLILSIALVALIALATTSFGQLSSIKERMFNKQSNEVEFITADYKSNPNTRIESWMHDLRSWSSDRSSGDTYVAPVVIYTINVENDNVVFEEELFLESWMAAPFKSSIIDEALTLEAWMTTPFEDNIIDENQILETWMITPFEAAEDIEMENWMATIWI